LLQLIYSSGAQEAHTWLPPAPLMAWRSNDERFSRTNSGHGIILSHVFPGKSGDEGSPHYV